MHPDPPQSAAGSAQAATQKWAEGSRAAGGAAASSAPGAPKRQHPSPASPLPDQQQAAPAGSLATGRVAPDDSAADGFQSLSDEDTRECLQVQRALLEVARPSAATCGTLASGQMGFSAGPQRNSACASGSACGVFTTLRPSQPGDVLHCGHASVAILAQHTRSVACAGSFSVTRRAQSLKSKGWCCRQGKGASCGRADWAQDVAAAVEADERRSGGAPRPLRDGQTNEAVLCGRMSGPGGGSACRARLPASGRPMLRVRFVSALHGRAPRDPRLLRCGGGVLRAAWAGSRAAAPPRTLLASLGNPGSRCISM